GGVAQWLQLHQLGPIVAAQLESLTLVGWRLPILAVRYIATMINLHTLCLPKCGAIGAWGLKMITSLPKLHLLDLSHTDTGETAFPTLRKMIHCEALSLAHCLISDYGASTLPIHSMDKLKRLDVTGVSRPSVDLLFQMKREWHLPLTIIDAGED